ncbi:hypothetical protein BASA81_000846 [Batrachochytrium salamandrivorans]|nr:hypothetical protein BASA81_000846 [Batrachochytrium salamandrivorans]
MSSLPPKEDCEQYRPRANSLTVQHRDAVFAGVGMLCGLLAFSRDLSDVFGGTIVLSFVLLALCTEEKTCSPSASFSNSRPKALVVVVLSWALLWSTLVCLEATNSRWSMPFALLYGAYFLYQGRDEPQARRLMVLSFAGLAGCVITSRMFAVHAGPKKSIYLAGFWHFVWWVSNWISNPQAIKVSPRAVLLDAPLFSVRDMFKPSAKISPHPLSSSQFSKM